MFFFRIYHNYKMMTTYLKTDLGIEELTPVSFTSRMGVEYLSVLEFKNTRFLAKMINLISKLEITSRQILLGKSYGRFIGSSQGIEQLLSWVDSIGGYGVFANGFIPKGAYIGEYTGKVRRRSFFSRVDNLYCLNYPVVNGLIHYVIDAEKKGNFTRYINHSFHPNVEIGSCFYKGMLHMVLYAITDIPKGGQLLWDYGEEYWKKRERPLIL
ncbi:MAG: SET domain-containing protein-lysine N-methyltransferase [Chlamydiales bacterium]|nr:SET domain-containing protein-lysine N-methyltransferase [Chlamydiales bacterium]